MGRIYSATFENVAVTALQDLFMLAPATDRPIVLHELVLSQSTELGDAEEEQLRLKVIRGHATVGSGGASITPVPRLALDTATGVTARRNDTTIASAGTPVDLFVDTWNVRAPYQHIWLPEDRPACTAAGTRLVVRLMANPADSVTMGGTLIYEEPF
jgi:hypothetical protein